MMYISTRLQSLSCIIDDKARYSAFKVTEVKTDEPKALVSVDSMVNWSDHAAENKTGEVEKVYGMMAGLHADNGGAGISNAADEFAMMGISPKVQNCPLGCDSKINDLNHMYNNLDRLYNDCYIKVQAYQHVVKTLESQKDWYHKTQIALEEKIRVLSANLENTTNTLSYTEKLHDQAQKEKKEWEVKYEATLARFEKWKESSKNLNKLINSSMSTRTKIGLGFKEYFGEDEVFDLSRPSTMYPEPVEEEVKPLYSRFVKAGEMHAVPPSITGTYMPTPYKSDIEETQVSYGSKSDNKTSETLSESNDFVSCDNSDKSSDSETYASCDSSLKTKTKDFPPAVDIKTLPESDVEDPNSTAGSPSFSCLENVKSPRIFCNKSGMNNRNVCKNNSVRVKKCFVCGSKLHLIKDCDFYNCVDSVPCKSKAASVPAGSRNSSASVTAGGSDPAASRNRPAVNSAGRPNPTGRVGQAAHLAAAQSNPAGWSKRPAPVSAGRPVSAGWLNPAARPYFRPSSVYFNNMYWPNLYDPMYMNKGRWGTAGDPSTDNDIGIVDSGCSRSMTGNKEKLDDFVQVKGGIVKFGGGDGRISGKGTIRTSKLDFENVYYVEELQHFNLFSVSQICDKKNKVLFTDTDCLVLTEEFQLPDESQVVLRIPRERDLYTFSISELQPEQNVTCLVAKASLDESTRWHRRMAHVNFKTINKLAKEGLVDGLPLKVFTNEHNCVACNKGKQHKASYKHISAVRLITETLQLLHMDLFGPTNIRSIDQKYYSLVVTDDFSRFTWTFFLGTKDETFYVLKEFIALIENQLNKKVKGIRCDNGTEFKNAKLIELCGEKGIKRDYSNPRTPQQNGVAERKNRTLIEAARTMLADSKLPTMFWTEAVSTACYVLNRVSITNPHNKTPYELISGKVPQIGHLKPFGCQVTILNTSDHLGKFEGKADEGYLVGYAPNSKAYRVYNLTNKRVEETMNLRFLEDKPNVQGIGHEWYFDLDYLTDSLGYTRFKTDKPAGTQETNINAGTQDHDSDSEVDEQVIVVPSFPSNSFAGPSSSNGPSVMERNADYAEELAKLQRQEYEAKDAAARYGYLFSQETAEILSQAEAEIRNQGVSADRDPAGIDSAGGVSAGSDPAGGNPAGSFQPAGSYEPAGQGNPAVSTSVSADFIPVHAVESTLPLGQSLGLTLIEAARTMLADSKLPTMFWTEAVSTACYVLNRVSITNPHNKTPYELISGKVPQISHLKPFGCQVTILNTSDYLGKFEGKADDGYLVGYASNSKAYRVYNLPNKRVEETLNLRFLEDKPNVQGIGHEWYFDLDYLTDSLGYTRFKTDTPAGTQETNINAGTQDHDSDSEVDEQVIVVPSFPSNRFVGPSFNKGPSIMERNADYAEELATLQRQEYEAKDAAARYGYLFSQATAEILCQAEAEIRNQGVSAVRDPASIDSAVRDPAGIDSAVRELADIDSAVRDPAGIDSAVRELADIDSAVRDPAGIVSADGVSTGSPSAGSDPARGNPADSFQPAGSFEPADESNPAVSSSVSAAFNPVYADESTLPPGQQLGSSENTTRFPVPSDVCRDQLSSGIFTSSSYD
ncbi:putative ribonuclease H-like domain-containing protein, partial [Tanacetum coccineum]